MSPRRPIATYACSALAVLIATHVLVSIGGRVDFEPYFGVVDPRLAVTGVSALGAAALLLMSRRGWRPLVLAERPYEAVAWFAAAVPFAVFAIVADLSIGFARDINVPAPYSLLFYPVMAFTVEVLFHAIPLAFLAFAFGASARTAWIPLALIALIEPAFQLRETALGWSMSALEFFVFGQVFGINIVELHVFRRHGFLAAWGFRLTYYLLWHVLWGYWRLL